MTIGWRADKSRPLRWACASLAVTALLAAAFATAVVSLPPIQSLLVANSDTLLPAAYAENLLRHPETIATFQLSRLPSFFPDLALYVSLFSLLPSWQSTAFAYAVVSYVAMVLVGGAVVGQVSQRGWRPGAMGFLAVSALALLLETELRGGTGALIYVFIPINHSGSVTLSLAGLLLGRRLLRWRSRSAGLGLFLLAVLGIASDKLFFGSFFVPLAAGAVAGFVVERGDGRRRLGIVAIAALGCAVGEGVDRLLFSTTLARMGDFPIHVLAQLRLVGPMLHDTSVRISLVTAAIVVLLPLTWLRRDALPLFWWAAGAVTVLGFLGLFPLLYADVTATRYVQPIWWWGVIVLTAAALRLAPRLVPGLATAAVGSVAVLTLAVLMGLGRNLVHPSLVLAYQSPTAACLAPWQERGVVHAGIAQYWEARPTEVSSNWKLQVEQTVNDGELFVWGSNPFYYTHGLQDQSKPPDFDFVVMKDMPPEAIVARFGQPSHVIKCPTTDVWTYSGPGARPGGFWPLIGNIKLANEQYGVLVGPACLRPQDFTTRAGPLRPDGIAVPAAAVPHDVDVWGPYLRLHAGSWRLHLAYRLDGRGPGARDWDVAVDSGRTVLQAGSLDSGGGGAAPMVRDIVLTVEHDTSPFELRSMLQPGDIFHIDSLGISPAAHPANPCEP